MTASYTFDVFASLDGYGSYGPAGDWGGYWGKQGPELLDHRLALYGERAADGLRGQHLPGVRGDAGREHRGVRRARPVGHRMRNLPATVVSSTLEEPLDWPDATVVERRRRRRRRPAEGGVRRAAALARQPVVELVTDGRRPGRPRAGDDLSGHHRQDRGGPVFGGAADFDLELLESRTLDGRTQELIYRPTAPSPVLTAADQEGGDDAEEDDQHRRERGDGRGAAGRVGDAPVDPARARNVVGSVRPCRTIAVQMCR